MTYEEIFSQFYSKKTDPTFFQKYSKDEAYSLMREWLHDIIGYPYVRKCFSSITLDDEILELDFTLKEQQDEYSDNYFVKNIIVQGFKICWLEQQVDSFINVATMIGGKEEKKLINNYKPNMERLEQMKIELKKTIRDRGYIINDYIGDK